MALCPASLRARLAPLYAWRPGDTTPFTIPDLRVHNGRSRCSPWPIQVFTMPDLCVHHQPIPLFTIVRNAQFTELGARSGVQRGMAVGSDLTVDTSKLTPEEGERLRRLLYNQRARPAPLGGLL